MIAQTSSTEAALKTGEKVLVLGIGNLLLGDEGVGIRVIEMLQQESPPPHVELLDGGTGGFHLLSYLEGFSTIVLIDATMDGKPAGTLELLEPRFASEYPPTLSAHDVGLKDLVESLHILGHHPRIHLITVSIESIQPMTLDLSPAVAQAARQAAGLTKQLVYTP